MFDADADSLRATRAVLLHRVEAGKVELDGAQYLGFELPFSIPQLCWIEALLVGGAEVYRNTELTPGASRLLQQHLHDASKRAPS